MRWEIWEAWEQRRRPLIRVTDRIPRAICENDWVWGPAQEALPWTGAGRRGRFWTGFEGRADRIPTHTVLCPVFFIILLSVRRYVFVHLSCIVPPACMLVLRKADQAHLSHLYTPLLRTVCDTS